MQGYEWRGYGRKTERKEKKQVGKNMMKKTEKWTNTTKHFCFKYLLSLMFTDKYAYK